MIYRRIITSIENELTTATVTCSNPAVDPDFSAEHLKTPQEPFHPAMSLDNNVTHWTIDRGASKAGVPVGLIVINRTNFTSFRIAGDSEPGFIAPLEWVEFHTIHQNPLNGRYMLAVAPVGLTQRYVRFTATSGQTPVEESGELESAFLIGGVWMGPTLIPPKNWLWEVEYEIITPTGQREHPHGAWVQSWNAGNTYAVISGQRIARVSFPSPFESQEFKDYLVYDIRLMESKLFALFLNAGDSTACLIAEPTVFSSTWQHARRHFAESKFSLREAIRS